MKADGRIDVLGLQVAIGETAIDIRQRHSGIEIDTLDRPVVGHEGKRVERTGAGAVADVNSGAGARRRRVVVLRDIVESADQVEAIVHGVFRPKPEDVLNPVDVVGVDGDADGRKILIVKNVTWDAVAADRLEARTLLPGDDLFYNSRLNGRKPEYTNRRPMIRRRGASSRRS